MESFLIKGAQLILALAMLITIHEFGHYLMARIFGIKVEKFYMFFNPWFSLVKWKPKKRKTPKLDKNGNERATWRDTEYGIGWIPLGGYVKIAGMIDESMDTDQMKQPEQPWEFRTKPAWQRLLVMVGGVTFNFILAVIIYAGIAWHWGYKYVPFSEAYEGMNYSPTALAHGFRNGDIPLKVNGKALDSSEEDIFYQIVTAPTVTVLRNHTDTVEIKLPSDFVTKLGQEPFMGYRQPVFVADVNGGSPAAEAGLQKDDRIVAVDTIATPSYTELTPALARYADRPTTITVERGGKRVVLNATPDSGGKLGFQLKAITDVYPVVYERYGFFESIPKGWELGTSTLVNYVGSLSHLFDKGGVNNLGGFGTIGKLFPDKWDWYSFWSIAAFLSVILAFMNIIPIPGLDGGHVFFLLVEMITRRKPSEKVLIYAQYAGMLFLILLLLYANGADIFRALK